VPELEDFIGQLRATELTKKAYAATLNQFTRWAGHIPGSADEAQQYLIYREAAGKSAATVARDEAALSRYLKYMKLPVERMERKKLQRKPPEYLTLEELQAAFKTIDVLWVKALIAVLYDTGARINEILWLKISGIRWEGFVWVRRKGGKEQWANCSDWGLSYLRQWLEYREGKHPLVFGGRTYAMAYNAMTKAMKEAGLEKFYPHMLRHSRAVHMLQAGDPLPVIAGQLGHVGINNTVIYTEVTPEDQKKLSSVPQVE